ncbi:MAG: transporter ATP-binding protein [Rhodospirillales bacterium]|nr:transporter ATP-binding protein [Rhodospirillales bacterium]
MTSLALEVVGVGRRFGGLVALRDVTFSVAEGEIVGLIGPNGAGKSTLFEIISGNMPPSHGAIRYFGADVTGKAAYLRRRDGLCRTFQKVRLFETMTVEQNVRVAASQCLPSGRSLASEVDDMLQQFHLGDLRHRKPSELTLADRKRVEIARAVAGACRLLMLDESLSGLTHDEAHRLVSEIILLNKSRGITVVIVEHVLSVLAAMVQRLVVLHNATIVAMGTPTEIANNPLVIEAYLGSQGGALT